MKNTGNKKQAKGIESLIRLEIKLMRQYAIKKDKKIMEKLIEIRKAQAEILDNRIKK